MLTVLPCVDSDEIAARRRADLSMDRSFAEELGRSAVEAAEKGYYLCANGSKVEWRAQVEAACAAKLSLSPDASLPPGQAKRFVETRVQVSNETTLGAAQRLHERGLRPLALNFANGVEPGGGFLHGARAQEEGLCRSSALYSTLKGDPMYSEHRKRPLPDSTEWAIYSPDVPVFRSDDGSPLHKPWLLSFVTCAAPYAPTVGQPRSGDLLEKRIIRVLAIARAYRYSSLVLGAWGCGAFENDPRRTATDFRRAIEGPFEGAFEEIVFAIADWSPDRKFLTPFRSVFNAKK